MFCPYGIINTVLKINQESKILHLVNGRYSFQVICFVSGFRTTKNVQGIQADDKKLLAQGEII